MAFTPEVAHILLIFLMKWRLYLWDRKKRLIRIEGKTKKALMERFIQYAEGTGYLRSTPPHWRAMDGGGYYRLIEWEGYREWWLMDGNSNLRAMGTTKDLFFYVMWKGLLTKVK